MSFTRGDWQKEAQYRYEGMLKVASSSLFYEGQSNGMKFILDWDKANPNGTYDDWHDLIKIHYRSLAEPVEDHALNTLRNGERYALSHWVNAEWDKEPGRK